MEQLEAKFRVEEWSSSFRCGTQNIFVGSEFFISKWLYFLLFVTQANTPLQSLSSIYFTISFETAHNASISNNLSHCSKETLSDINKRKRKENLQKEQNIHFIPPKHPEQQIIVAF